MLVSRSNHWFRSGRAVGWVGLVVTALVLGGCRFGGPQVAPSPGDAAIAEVGAVVPPLIDVADPISPVADAGRDLNAPTADTEVDTGPRTDAATVSCGAAPFSAAVCDPVCNVGCPALLRCDVSDVPHTGTCVGIWLTQEGDICFKGSGTDACAIGLTCLEGRCARLCYRDTDCKTASTCCTRELEGPSGKTGFKVCAPCGP